MGDIGNKSWNSGDLRRHCIQEENRKKMENNTLAVYGILKKGYELDLLKEGCEFLGEGFIAGSRLYGIGGRHTPSHKSRYSGVGLRLDVGPSGVDDARVQLFKIPSTLWNWLDGLENNGVTYTRKVVKVECPAKGASEFDFTNGYTLAWVYEHSYKGFGPETLIEGGVF